MTDHFVAEGVAAGRCRLCGVGATHRVREIYFEHVDPRPAPNVPAFGDLCCGCFRRVVGPTDRCLITRITEDTKAWWFGCWLDSGHYFFDQHGRGVDEDRLIGVGWPSLDGNYAPRRDSAGRIIHTGVHLAVEDRRHVTHRSEECPQGQFLVHNRMFKNGCFTIMSWWDRTQGDTRGACNSTYIVDVPVASVDDLLAWFPKHFPKQAERLAQAGVQLVSVTR